MTEYKGIDISEYQGAIDWNTVRRAGVTFAMLRCGYGRFDSQIDERFHDNYDAAVKAGGSTTRSLTMWKRARIRISARKSCPPWCRRSAKHWKATDTT